MTEISASAASARESARRSDGRFGTQSHSEPRDTLSDHSTERDLEVTMSLVDKALYDVALADSGSQMAAGRARARCRIAAAIVDPRNRNNLHARLPEIVMQSDEFDDGECRALAERTLRRAQGELGPMSDDDREHVALAGATWASTDLRHAGRSTSLDNSALWSGQAQGYLDGVARVVAPDADEQTWSRMADSGADLVLGFDDDVDPQDVLAAMRAAAQESP